MGANAELVRRLVDRRLHERARRADPLTHLEGSLVPLDWAELHAVIELADRAIDADVDPSCPPPRLIARQGDLDDLPRAGRLQRHPREWLIVDANAHNHLRVDLVHVAAI